jgi:hypothetical protein
VLASRHPIQIESSKQTKGLAIMRFSTPKNSVSVKVLVALSAMGAAGIASATCPTCEAAAAQPSANTGFVRGVITTTAVNSANVTANIVSSFSNGLSSTTISAALPAGVTRFALPGQGGTGAAAAPGGKAWNAWFGYSRSDIAYEYKPLESDGNVDVYLAGVDYTLKNNIVIGLAIAVDSSDIKLKGTSFGAAGGKMDADGTTYTFYTGIPINKNWSADLSAGWGKTEVTTKVFNTKGEMDDDRSVFTGGLTYRQLFGAGSKWMVTGRGGYIYVKDRLGSYTMSNGTFVPSGKVEVSQARIGGQAAYNMGTFVPYAGLSYIYDFKEPNQAAIGGVKADNDRDGMQGTLGIRFSVPNGFYGGLQYSSEFSRSEIKNDQWMLNLGTRF